MSGCNGRTLIPCLFGLNCPHNRKFEWCYEHYFDSRTKALVTELIELRKSLARPKTNDDERSGKYEHLERSYKS